jgi:peptide/nickel transport system ATP-binding protein
MAAGQLGASQPEGPLLEVVDFKVQFRTDVGVLHAVDGVNFTIDPGETLGLVGESGCGKSVTAFSILKLLPQPPARYVSGEIFFGGENLLQATERRLRSIRGNLISMVFQDPLDSLNPILTIGAQIVEAVTAHRRISKRRARELALEMLGQVGIPSPSQLSGGMIQRAMIAMALVCNPRLLIADEPTTAVDVTIQAQILDLLGALQRDFHMAILLITHDLGVVAETCDRVAVMYAGIIVESASTSALFERPSHPYTLGLFRSLPSASGGMGPLPVIPGVLPNPLDLPSGCRFRSRCWMQQEICATEPALREVEPDHFAACHFAEELRHSVRVADSIPI